MVSESDLFALLADPGRTRKETVLLILASAQRPLQVAEIKGLGKKNGLHTISNWNVSQVLGSLRGLVGRVEDGWVLTPRGSERVGEIEGIETRPEISTALARDLRKAAAEVGSPEVVSFLEEAVVCFDKKLYRAAVVLTWVGAVAVLKERVVSQHLVQFNGEAARRDKKWKTAKTTDDLSRMKEHDFLQVLEAISVIGKSVKRELEGCLVFRNGAGHPNSLKLGEARAAAHIETLVLNVFGPFN